VVPNKNRATYKTLITTRYNKLVYKKEEGDFDDNIPQIKDYTRLYIKQDKPVFTIDDYDWREIIYQMALDYSKHNHEERFYYDIATSNKDYYPNGITNYEKYYTDLLGFWRNLYNPDGNADYFDSTAGEQKYWNKSVYNNATGLIFWFDFLDAGEAEISKYSVSKIGLRSKVTNSTSGNTTIFANKTPEVIYSNNGASMSHDAGY
jgi:hypothetical protein